MKKMAFSSSKRQYSRLRRHGDIRKTLVNYARVNIHGKLRSLNSATAFQAMPPASFIPPAPNLSKSSKESVGEIRNTVPNEIVAFDEQNRIYGCENLLNILRVFKFFFF